MDIKSKVIELIEEVSEIKNIKPMIERSELLEDLGINSMVFISLVVEVENEFGVEFDDDNLDYRDFDTVTSICDYINTLLL
ncbi:MAG: acyl carrier protein [Lachnospiraceae bacterium]|nr:acyl carrier protein [Lachnospiraceae bacterium]